MTTTTSAAEAVTETSAPTRRLRWRAWGRTVILLALVVGAAVWWSHGRLWETVPSRPYADPAAVGRLTLCSGGAAVTSGPISRPLAEAVIGDHVPAGGTATLYAFQPRLGVDPSSWTGVPLSAPATYGSKTPLVGLGSGLTLRQFLGGYPATDHGYVELRLIVAQPDHPISARTYDALDVYVHGSTWKAVSAGHSSCRS